MWPWQRRSRFRADNGGSAATRPRPALFLGVTLLLSLSVGAVHNNWREHGKTDPLVSFTRTALYPFQAAGSQIKQGVENLWSGFTAGPRLLQENTRLRAEIEHLRLENQALRTCAEESEHLRAELGFARSLKRPPLAARVIGLLPSPHFETITIDRGTQHGVKPRSIVRTSAGLVGQVIEVSPLTSQVLLLTDGKFRVHAALWRDGKPLGIYGIVQGAGRGEAPQAIYFKREDDVRPGDVLRSSGFGNVVPPDIPIGTVEAVTEDTANFLKSARIAPLAPQGSELREALVLQ